MSQSVHRWGSKAAWSAWNPPKVLWEGQHVRVHRWQNLPNSVGEKPNGHYEDGIITKVLVEVKGAPWPARVLAFDLSEFRLEQYNKTRKSARPAIGIEMRNNVFWLKEYLVESLEQGDPPWPPKPVVVAARPSVFDFGNKDFP